MITRRSLNLTFLATPFVARAAMPANIKIVSGFAAGGTLDPMGRFFAEFLAKRFKANVVFEAMPGAGGRLAGEFVQKSANDGSVLLLGNIASIVLTPLTFATTKYDSRKDFTPLCLATEFQIALSVSKSSGIQSLKDLVAFMKANPEKAAYGIPATGSLPHLVGLDFERIAGVKLQPVAYRGTAQIVNDMVGGHLNVGITAVSDIASQHNAGGVKCLAISGVKRNDTIPNVPTFAESGITGLDKNGWQGIMAPAGMDAGLAGEFTQSFIEVLKQPDTVKRLNDIGFIVTAQDGKALLAQITADYEKYAPIIEKAGLRQ